MSDFTPLGWPAYIDPGTGSLVLQVIVGTIFGLLVSAKLYWQRITHFFRQRSSGGKAPTGDSAVD